jgi:hypothetical protein
MKGGSRSLHLRLALTMPGQSPSPPRLALRGSVVPIDAMALDLTEI